MKISMNVQFNKDYKNIVFNFVETSKFYLGFAKEKNV